MRDLKPFDLKGRIIQVQSEVASLRAAMRRETPVLISSLCDGGKPLTLREVARRTRLSPTYISRCWHGAEISMYAFLKLLKLRESVYGRNV